MAAKVGEMDSLQVTKECWKLLLQTTESIKLKMLFLKYEENEDGEVVADFSDGEYIYAIEVANNSSAALFLSNAKNGIIVEVWAAYQREDAEFLARIVLSEIVPLDNKGKQFPIPSDLPKVPVNLEELDDGSLSRDYLDDEKMIEDEIGDLKSLIGDQESWRKNSNPEPELNGAQNSKSVFHSPCTTKDLKSKKDGSYRMSIKLRIGKVFSKLTKNCSEYLTTGIAFDEYGKVQLQVFYDPSVVTFEQGKAYLFEGLLHYQATPNKYFSFVDVPKLKCWSKSTQVVRELSESECWQIPQYLHTNVKDFKNHNSSQQEVDLVDHSSVDFQGRLAYTELKENTSSPYGESRSGYRMKCDFHHTNAIVMLWGSCEELKEIDNRLFQGKEYIFQNLKYKKPSSTFQGPSFSSKIRLHGGKYTEIQSLENSSSPENVEIPVDLRDIDYEFAPSQETTGLGKRELPEQTQPKERTSDELIANLLPKKPGVMSRTGGNQITPGDPNRPIPLD